MYEQRLLSWSLGIGVVVGLAAHVGGYLLKSSATTEPVGLVADLLYAPGWALWTGVVVEEPSKMPDQQDPTPTPPTGDAQPALAAGSTVTAGR